MSLKNIHVVFITLATLLCLLFASWCWEAYRAEGGAGMLAFAVGSFGAALGLVVYGTWFLRKMKGIGT